jgi:hypothetical protein
MPRGLARDSQESVSTRMLDISAAPFAMLNKTTLNPMVKELIYLPPRYWLRILGAMPLPRITAE